MSTATNTVTDEKEKTWKWIEARLWQNTQSGVYYERPVVKGRPTFRSLKTRNRKHAVDELFKRRTAVGAGEDPYAEPEAVTVGEVVRRYQKDGYLDRDLQPRPPSTLADEERNCKTLLEFWDLVDVTAVTDATCDKYRDWRKKRVQQGTGDRAIDRELNTLNNAFRYGKRREAVPVNPIADRPRYPPSRRASFRFPLVCTLAAMGLLQGSKGTRP
jgi:hypothetical protein